MKLLAKAFVLLYLLFLFAVALSQDGRPDSARVDQRPRDVALTIKMARAIEEKMPVSVDSTFNSTEGKVYCWSAVAGAGDTLRIYHVWSFNGREQSRVPIKVYGPYFRAFTFQRFTPEQAGDWTVYVVDDRSNVLGMSRFRVEPADSTTTLSEHEDVP